MADTALDKENPARKILIIGSVGAGKTTIARRLSQKVGIPHYELDCVAREGQVGPAASARRNSKWCFAQGKRGVKKKDSFPYFVALCKTTPRN